MIIRSQRQLINCIRNLRRIYDCGYYHQSFDMISLYLDIIKIVYCLGDRDKEIIVRRFLLEETPSEVARVKHCSIANITQRSDKAISRFIRAYQEHYQIELTE